MPSGFPDYWKISKLGEVCQINPSRTEVAGLPDGMDVSFVPMAAVSEEGMLLESKTRKFKEVKKGFPHFKERDVLVAKITPCFENGKRWLASSLVNGIGFGSTEFHVLRAGKDVLPEWIYYFISSPTLRKDGKGRMTGTAGQKRVPASFLEQYKIPVPPITVQERIVRPLRRAEKLREVREQANQLTSRIIQSVFLKIFGDPAKNPKKFELRKLPYVSKLERGKFGHRPRTEPRFYGGKHPFIQIGDIPRNTIYIRSYSQTLNDKGFAISKMFPRGTIVIAIAATIGEVGILDFDSCFPDSLVGITPDQSHVTPEYLYCFLTFMKERLTELAPLTAQRNINLKILAEVDIPLPQLHEQRKFSGLVQKMEKIRARQEFSTSEINELFHSLMHKAFRGELAGA
jgi:type I restriction enzyme S subunit